MDCNTARMLATFFGRGGSELAADDAAALATHLASCPACTAAIAQERVFDDRISKAMLAVPVPTHLKSKLLDNIDARAVAPIRNKVLGAVGLAAAVCLSIGGVIGYRILNADTLDVQQVLAQADDDARNPQEYVDRLLSADGVNFDPAQRFDMKLLVSVGPEKFQGHTVPTLKFVNTRKNSTATVYVLKSTQFKWDHLIGQPPMQGVEGFGHQVVLVEHSTLLNRAYLVVFTGDSLETFLDKQSSLNR